LTRLPHVREPEIEYWLTGRPRPSRCVPEGGGCQLWRVFSFSTRIGSQKKKVPISPKGDLAVGTGAKGGYFLHAGPGLGGGPVHGTFGLQVGLRNHRELLPEAGTSASGGEASGGRLGRVSPGIRPLVRTYSSPKRSASDTYYAAS
jgi:hypothetical protein